MNRAIPERTDHKYEPYPEYRDPGVGWLGEIPMHWEVWKVAHGFNKIGSGTTPQSNNLSYYGGDIPWVTTTELRETLINDTSAKLTAKALKEYSALKLYPENTLLIAMYGATIGRLGILNIPATVNQACCAFSEATRFCIKFFYYWLIYHRPVLISLSAGGGQPNLSQDDLKSLRVPLPPASEQQAIAEFLDEETSRIDELIAKKQRLIELLQKRRIALITRTVTKGLNPEAPMRDSGVEWLGQIPDHWEAKRLRFLAKINPSKTEISDLPPSLEISFVPMEDVGCGVLNIEKTQELDSVSEGYTYFRNGDVLVAKITPCFENGKGAISEGLFNGIGFGTTELHVIRSTLNINRRFLLYITICHAFRSIGESEMYGTAGQKRVSDEFIRNFICPYPSKQEQQAITDYLDRETSRIDNLIGKINQAIEKLQEYRSALITAAVTGKIDVRGEIVRYE